MEPIDLNELHLNLPLWHLVSPISNPARYACAPHWYVPLLFLGLSFLLAFGAGLFCFPLNSSCLSLRVIHQYLFSVIFLPVININYNPCFVSKILATEGFINVLQALDECTLKFVVCHTQSSFGKTIGIQWVTPPAMASSFWSYHFLYS